MSQKALTKDERFLLQLAKLANGEADVYIDPNLVAKATGMKEKSLKSTIRMLCQINCIRKDRATSHIALTYNGLRVLSHLS